MFKIERIRLDLETGLLNFIIKENKGKKDNIYHILHCILVSYDNFQLVEKKLVPQNANLGMAINEMVRQLCIKDSIAISIIYSCQIKQANYKIRLLKSFRDWYYQFVSNKKINKPIKIQDEKWEIIRNDLLTKFSATIIYLDTYTKVPSIEKIKDILFSLIIKK